MFSQFIKKNQKLSLQTTQKQTFLNQKLNLKILKIEIINKFFIMIHSTLIPSFITKSFLIFHMETWINSID
jgi:hypothetical protein